MNLRELIDRLELEDPDLIIPNAFNDPHSYRGYYQELSFEPGAGPVTIHQLLQLVKSCLGQVFIGYKGGDFKMHEFTDVYLANFGQCGDMLSMGHLEAMIQEAHQIPLGKSIRAVIDSADDTGCTEDLTVVSKSAIEALEEAFDHPCLSMRVL